MARRPPKKMTRRRLGNITAAYLQRYSTTRAHLRRLLIRRLDRSLEHHEGDRDEAIGWIDDLLDQHVRMGTINDRAWASSRLRKLGRRGLSVAKMRAQLRAKGIDGALIDELLDALAPDPRTAAAHYARRRRIGPFRPPHKEADPQRELAKLGRAGFPYGIARDVLEMDLDEACELTDPR